MRQHSILNIHIAIRHFRERQDITQEKLAELAGLDRTFISLIECGKRNPSLATIEKIAAALNMHAWEILKYVAETAAQ